MTRWWPANQSDPMAPLALALTHHFETNTPQTVEFLRGDGEIYDQTTDEYFAAPDDLDELEQIALETVRSPVLDVGAACGRTALALQTLGVQVTALDVSPVMTSLMRKRGVTDIVTMDIYKLFVDDNVNQGRWTTALFLMETIGLSGDTTQLALLLEGLHRTLGKQARIILDSAPLMETGSTASVELQIRFDGQTGPSFPWLYLDSQRLADVAAKSGWQTELGYLDNDTGHFLARLTREGDHEVISD